jgi:hypothetical protein
MVGVVKKNQGTEETICNYNEDRRLTMLYRYLFLLLVHRSSGNLGFLLWDDR